MAWIGQCEKDTLGLKTRSTARSTAGCVNNSPSTTHDTTVVGIFGGQPVQLRAPYVRA